MAQTEPLIHWPQPFIEYAGFIAAYLASGAVGFRYAVLRNLGRGSAAPIKEERSLLESVAGRAAALGLSGAVLGVVLLASKLPELAARRHVPVARFVIGSAPVAVQFALALVAVAGFAMALRRRSPGWPLAAIGVIAGALRSVVFAQWSRLVNPVHVLAGGMWLGTLFVLVFVGLAAVLRSPLAPERRATLAAEMVNGFSPLALVSAAVLASFGLLTAWMHLKTLSALWTTPYGYALIVKLCIVLAVVALGAWNWRRQRPRMGTKDGVLHLRRKAWAELAVAALVLAVTAVLVSLPSPG